MASNLAVIKRETEQEKPDADFAVSIKVRNGRLLSAIRKAGYTSANGFCTANGMSRGAVQGFITMTRSPIGRDRRPTALAQTVADTLNCLVEDLFPPAFLAKCLSQLAKTELPMTEDQIGMLLREPPRTPEEVMLLDEAAKQISDTLLLLPPRTERLLRLRHAIGNGKDEISLRAAGKLMGDITPERVRQIEARGIRQLQLPSRKQHLQDAADTLGVVRKFTKLRPPAPITKDAERRRAGVLMAGEVKPEPKLREPETVARPIRPRKFPEPQLTPYEQVRRLANPIDRMIWRFAHAGPGLVMDMRDCMPPSTDGYVALVNFTETVGYSVDGERQIAVNPGYYIVPLNTLGSLVDNPVIKLVQQFPATEVVPHAI